MIIADNIYKKINDKVILDNVSLKVEKGSITGLIGSNGAGKSSLLKIFSGIWQIDDGSVQVNGDTPLNPAIRRVIAYVPEESNFLPSYNIGQLKKLYELTYNSFDRDYFYELLEIFSLNMKQRLKKLSKGMKTKLALSLSLSIKPEVLILDEPFDGLDVLSRRVVMGNIIDNVAQYQTTVIISSHNLKYLERLCDRIAFIEEGKLVLNNSLDELKNKYRKLQVVFDEDNIDISSWKQILHLNQQGRVNHLFITTYSEEFKSKLREEGAVLVEEIDMDLEEMFCYCLGLKVI